MGNADTSIFPKQIAQSVGSAHCSVQYCTLWYFSKLSPFYLTFFISCYHHDKYFHDNNCHVQGAGSSVEQLDLPLGVQQGGGEGGYRAGDHHDGEDGDHHDHDEDEDDACI